MSVARFFGAPWIDEHLRQLRKTAGTERDLQSVMVFFHVFYHRVVHFPHR